MQRRNLLFVLVLGAAAEKCEHAGAEIKLPVNAAARREVTSWKRAGTMRIAIIELMTPKTRKVIVTIGPGVDCCGTEDSPFITQF